MASLVFKHKSYYGVFSVRTKKRWIKIGKVGKKEAAKILKRLELEFAKDRLNLYETKPTSFYDFVNMYLEYAKTNKADSTYKREQEIVIYLKKFFGNISIAKIDSHRIEAYKTKRVKRELKPATVNKELSVLRFMLNKAHEWKYLDKTPRVTLLKIPREPAKFLNNEELNMLIKSASSWLKPMLIVLRNSGLRLGELLSLKFSDVDYGNRNLLVRSNKTNNFRVIPMNKELNITLSWLKENYPLPHIDKAIPRNENQIDYVFCNPDGSKLVNIRNSFKKACEKANIRATPHTLRHTFASLLIMNGASIASVKELLGHTQISTTMIYSHLSADYKARTVERLPWIKTKFSTEQ